MLSGLNIKVKNSSNGNNPNDGTSHINVCVAYNKDRRMVRLDVTPVKDMGNGVVSFMLASGHSVKMEDMYPLRRKRLIELQGVVDDQIEARSGRAWDIVQNVMAEHGLELANEEAA